MSKKRYLTKSRFKLACECATKLFYTGKKEYADRKMGDSFLAALADGGFQVGELAKCHFPGGHDIKTLDHDDALAQTAELMLQDDVVIYEAAVSYQNLFIRADILEKRGNKLFLYEVKAKSYNPSESNPFLKRDGFLQSKWEPYLYDAAFQKHVLMLAMPGHDVKAHLMMADKSSICPTEGLNQKFKLIRDTSGRKSVAVAESLNSADLEEPILCKINVDKECELIFSGEDKKGGHLLSFADRVELFSSEYAADNKIETAIGSKCADCEFKATEADEKTGLKSGFKECWKRQLGWNDKDFENQTVLDVWNFRKKDELIADSRIKMDELAESDINPKADDKPGLSASERQWLQIKKYQERDNSIWIDAENLKAEIDSWIFPLHFIDFETTMTAIPFNSGRHPYEGIAFQFSHHTVDENGKVEHKGEYLNTQQGVFPNYDFIRELKSQLENDTGSIFRYSNHENTYLNIIYRQLKDDMNYISDRLELSDFIRTITKSSSKSETSWVGDRNMIDMWELVKRYYYDPATKGSNSIKYVLPAVLNSSEYLKEKYSKPIYGAEGGIKSLNYTDWQWIKFEGGRVIDPYRLLPRMFQDVSDKNMQLLSEEDELREGGAAMTAYARMQFTQMSDYERDEICRALLKYCELDTMAMVMIYEGWREMI